MYSSCYDGLLTSFERPKLANSVQIL